MTDLASLAPERLVSVREVFGIDSDLQVPASSEIVLEGVKVFHAGTKRDTEGRWLSDGGRVLGVGDDRIHAVHRHQPWDVPRHHLAARLPHNVPDKENAHLKYLNFEFYRAYSTARVSRMTVTLICPGYSISSSIRLAMSRAMTKAA